jgi:hypothetical protein
VTSLEEIGLELADPGYPPTSGRERPETDGTPVPWNGGNMERRLRKTKTLAAALTLMLAVAACDSDDPVDGDDGATTTVAELTTTTAAG